ncbi:MAG: GNAT family N-acetyltransferase [Streptosporangiaceae bacterium]
MAERYPMRPIAADEFDAFHHVTEQAFHEGPPSERARAGMLSRTELDRTLAAFDGTTPVSSAAIYSFRMCVPGALAAVGGVTFIAVHPAYRRRGILSALMRRQLDDMHDRGETLAALWASEAGIYGRFGYGRASRQAKFTVHRGEGGFVPGAPADPRLRLRVAEPHAVTAELAKVYDTLLPAQPGLFSRNDAWWRRVLADPEEDRHGGGPLRCLLAEDDAGPRGYALYHGHGRWDDDTFLSDSRLDIRELGAADPAANAALWADLLNRDLITETVARLRPEDDPLLHLLADPRRARPAVADGLWVRVVDVPGALSLRRYPGPVDVVIEVADDWCPWNQGRWRLTAGSGEVAASCQRTGEPADLILPVAALGAAYLGSTRLGTLAGAGQVTELRSGTLNALSAAMTWDPAPWCPVIF